VPDTPAERNRYELRLDRDALREKEAIAADIANNLVHALDHVVAACVRINGLPNTRDFYYPLVDEVTFKTAKFKKRMAKLEEKVGPIYAAALERMRLKAAHQLPHLLAIKALSNSCKHWELAPMGAAGFGVAFDLPGKGKQGIGIPVDHFDQLDTFQFVVPHGKPRHFEIIIGLGFVGLTPEMRRTVSYDPMSQYVLDVITEFETIAGGP